jgi:photosystem II stability/assembly factor-like uncharacterized protein
VGQVTGVLGSDNGLAWNSYSVGLPTNITATGFAQHGTDIFVGGYGCGVYRSSDNGQTWVAKNSNGTIYLTFALLVRHDTIFQGTLGNFYRSTNNGDNWNTATIGLPTNPYVYGLGNVGGVLLAGVEGTIYTSRNGGNSWQAATVPSGRFTHFFTLDANTAIAGSDQGGLFRTTDRGATWTVVPVGTNTSTPGVSGFAKAANGLLFAASGNGIFISNDNAASWHPANKGFLRNVDETTQVGATAVAVLRDSVYASNGGGLGIWVRPLSEFVITGTKARLETPSLTVYPNPATSIFQISGQLAYAGQTISLMDMAGKVLRSYPATQTSLGLEGIKPGLYVVQVGKQHSRLVVE